MYDASNLQDSKAVFTKKIVNCLFYLSLFLIVIGTLIILFTPQILEVLPNFLEEKVFHRTFNHAAYKKTMISLIAFPIFFAIVIDALCFAMFSDKKKTIVSAFFFVSVLLTITIVSYTFANPFTEQDLSSETLFAYECFRAKTFWPTSWYYSMEFRFLNTQLVTMPLFFFTKNLAIIRALTVLFTELVLFAAVWFLLHELKVKAFWLKLLCSTLMISPVSWQFFHFVHAGSYYIPHIAFSFFYVGLAISLLFHEHTPQKEKRLTLIFFALAFLSGLSTIRYILNFTFPVFAIVAIETLRNAFKSQQKISVKSILSNKAFKIVGGGLLLSCIGYVLNSTILASIYTFRNMNKVQFNYLDIMNLDQIKNMILIVAGYNEDMSVFTPGGVANILLSVVFVLTIIVSIDYWKIEKPGYKKFFLYYFIFFLGFHFYINVFTEMVDRYFTMPLAFFVPFLAVVIEGVNISSVKKWILSASSAILIFTNAYICFSKMETSDSSMELGGVCDFLSKNDYEFGYAFYNIANPIWFWSNGAVEVVTVENDESNGANIMAKDYKIHRWLEPKRFENKDYYKGNKHVFFAMKNSEYALSADSNVFKSGTLVYQDDKYVVFDYASPEAFIKAFENE